MTIFHTVRYRIYQVFSNAKGARRCLGSALSLGLALTWLVGLPAAAAAQSSERIVVLISLDGLAGYYLQDAKAEMPTIRALAEAGARSSQMRVSTPSVTWPNHATLVTGANPAVHGVVGNNYLDRETGNRVRLIADPVYDKDRIVKVPTIYDLAKARGLTTTAIRWPATRNAKTLDWMIPDMTAGEATFTNSTPALLRDCERAGIPFGVGKNRNDTSETLEVIYTRIFNLVLREHRPQLALLHLSNVDHIQHLHGPRSPEAYAAIKAADERVREVWEELKREFPDRATLFVVSDHGFSPVKRALLPNVLLRKAGLFTSPTNGPVQIVPQGGTAFVYVMDKANRARLLRQTTEALSSMDGLSQIVPANRFKKYGVADPALDPHAPDLILFAQLGCVFGDTAAGDLPFKEKPERAGSHGHDPNFPDLKAMFVAWGVGIKPKVELGKISSLSVAPTVAQVLGISMPAAEGKPLRKALATRGD